MSCVRREREYLFSYLMIIRTRDCEARVFVMNHLRCGNTSVGCNPPSSRFLLSCTYLRVYVSCRRQIHAHTSRAKWDGKTRIRQIMTLTSTTASMNSTVCLSKGLVYYIATRLTLLSNSEIICVGPPGSARIIGTPPTVANTPSKALAMLRMYVSTCLMKHTR